MRLSAEAADAPSRNAQAMMRKENRMGAPAMEERETPISNRPNVLIMINHEPVAGALAVKFAAKPDASGP